MYNNPNIIHNNPNIMHYNPNTVQNNPNIVHINNIFNNVEQNKNFKIKGGNYIYNNNSNQINYININAKEGKINPNNTIQNINKNPNFYNYINNNKVNNLNNIGNQQLNKNKFNIIENKINLNKVIKKNNIINNFYNNNNHNNINNNIKNNINNNINNNIKNNNHNNINNNHNIINNNHKLINHNIKNNNHNIINNNRNIINNNINNNNHSIINNNINNHNNINNNNNNNNHNHNNINNNINNQNIYDKIYAKINIFNSLLIMINNISFIIDYFSKDLIQNIINKCEENDQYCLTSILYYINRYMHRSNNPNLISKKEVIQKYLNFIECLTKTNFPNSYSNSCYYDINNIIRILNFVYEKINQELTKVNLESNDNYNIFSLNYENDPLLKYTTDFS